MAIAIAAGEARKKPQFKRSIGNCPMPNPRTIYDDELFAHFITFSCYKRRNLLTLDKPRQKLLGTLTASLKRHQGQCVGFVIMPNHVHAIVWFPVANQLSRFMQVWKRDSSASIKNWYRAANIAFFEKIPTDDPIWQSKYYSFEIYAESKLEEKLNYMHENPVRAGLVSRVVDWRWSSARHYHEGKTVGIPIQWVE